MEFFRSNSFLMVLSESIKLLTRNGRLMAFIAIFSVFLSSSLFLLFSYSLQRLVFDMSANMQKSIMPDLLSFNMSDPNSFSSADPSSFTPKTGFNPDQITTLIREDLAILFAVQIPLFFVFTVISFFSSISTILVSSISYGAKNLSLKELFSKILKTWKSPLITTLYVSVLAMGYFVIVFIFAAPLIIYPSIATYWVAILLLIIALVFYLHLFVTWGLAVVVSVVEKSCYGLEALERAAKLVKGNKLHGFLLNICFNLVALIIFQGLKMILLGKKGLVDPTLYGLSVVIVSCLAKIFMVVAYTVLYFQCKVQHGEEIELHGSVKYS